MVSPRPEEEAWRQLVEREVGHADSKLYGGSQYHRSLREFALAVQHMALPEVSPDEIANAAGVNEVHDGTNYMRAACVIAVSKAQTSFEPLIDALQVRARHVMRRLFPIAEHMLEAKGVGITDAAAAGATRLAADPAQASAQHAAFTEAVHKIFNDFVESALAECLARCEDDLRGMTRFVTWDLHERGSLAVQDSLPSKEMVNIYALTMKKKKRASGGRRWEEGGEGEEAAGGGPPPRRGRGRQAAAEVDPILEQWEAANEAAGAEFGYDASAAGRGAASGALVAAGAASSAQDGLDVLHLMEQVACMRDGDRTTKVVSALVQHIVRAWRMSFAQNVAMKFNCFFLLPFLEEFPFFLRTELDRLYGSDLAHLFDVSEARAVLEHRLVELEAEAAANRKLQAKFEAVNQQLGPSGRAYRAEKAATAQTPAWQGEDGEVGGVAEAGFFEEEHDDGEAAVGGAGAYYYDEAVEEEAAGVEDEGWAGDLAGDLDADLDGEADDWWMEEEDQ